MNASIVSQKGTKMAAIQIISYSQFVCLLVPMNESAVFFQWTWCHQSTSLTLYLLYDGQTVNHDSEKYIMQ